MNEMKGKVVDMARSQPGSKQLQKIFSHASSEFINFAIEECLS